MNNVLTESFFSPKINRREILRYAGIMSDFEPDGLDECIKQAENVLTYRVCYNFFDIEEQNGMLDLGFAQTMSNDLKKALNGCTGLVLFAASVGVGIESLIIKNRKLSPSKALLFDAIGSERVESLCDVFCGKICQDNPDKKFRPRFSPGYGDFPLTVQNKIFAALNPEKNIGVTLNNSLLMSPSKSVTAIMGFSY